jgi:hypothetical protein
MGPPITTIPGVWGWPPLFLGKLQPGKISATGHGLAEIRQSKHFGGDTLNKCIPKIYFSKILTIFNRIRYFISQETF